MKKPTRPAYFRLGTLAAAVAGLGATSAYADLNLIPGMNPVQSSAAAVTQSVCPRMAQAQESLTSSQLRLLDSCTKLIVTSIEQRSPTQSPSEFDLGLSEAGLRDALQAVAPEEINGLSRARTTSLAKPLSARLLALRKSSAGGGLASSTFEFNGHRMALSDVLPRGSSGGAAGADALGGSRWGGFVNGHYNWGDRDRSSLEDAFDFRDYGITAGVDYRFSDALVAGVAVSYSDTEVDFDRNLGEVESDDLGVSIYGSYHTGGGFFIDGHAGFSRIDFDTARRILVVSTTSAAGFDTTARGSTDSDQITASIGAGYDHARGDMTISPFARLNYLHLDTDGFREREPLHGLGLDVSSRSVSSLVSALGVNLTKAISTGAGVISPYLGAEWNHEFRNDSRGIVAKYSNDPFNTGFVIPTSSPDRNYFTARAGLTGTFPNGMSAFVNLESVLGLQDTSHYALTAGLRAEF